jgi:hypothetical protein
LEAWRKAGHDALVKWWPDVKAVFSAVITRSAQEEPVARDTSQPEDSDQRLY